MRTAVKKAITFVGTSLCILAFQFVVSGNAAAEMRYVNFNPSKNSQYFFYPVSFYINTAFDCGQVPEAFPQNDYFSNHVSVFNRVVNPVRSINRDGGWSTFFIDEFFSERVLPNLTLHMIGGGYDCRTLWEWYHYHGFPVPYLFAFLTSYLAHFGNESIEYNNSLLTSHDHIADLFVFDFVGNLMFMSEDVARFFRHTLQMRNWLGQPVYSMTERKIMNASTSYIFRPYLFGETVRPFIYMGMHYLGGAAFRIDETDTMSIGVGLAVTKPFDPDRDTQSDYFRKVRLACGVFYDREDALLWSLIINGTEQYVFRLNIYPEIFNSEYINFGFYVAIDDDRHFVFGVSMYKICAIGATL